jgi:hypothetical protein
LQSVSCSVGMLSSRPHCSPLNNNPDLAMPKLADLTVRGI